MESAVTDLLPIADGGDGTIDALYQSIGGTIHNANVDGPDSSSVIAPWLEFGQLAIVELAAASGLGLLRGRLEPMHSHTRGTGQVIGSCLDSGMKNIVICLGGSASTDGGAGLLMALGAKFWKLNGESIVPGASELSSIQGCNLREAIKRIGSSYVAVAVDVSNPLLGAQGAASIYGPQKGANRAMIEQLDVALQHFADVLEMATSREARNIPGAGAAGGTAFGIACALGGEIISGFDWMSTLIGLEERVEAADLVITGEGKLDEQSFYGKAIGRLTAICKRYNRPLIAIPAIADMSCDWKRLGISRVICAARQNATATLKDVIDTAGLAVSEKFSA